VLLGKLYTPLNTPLVARIERDCEFLKERLKNKVAAAFSQAVIIITTTTTTIITTRGTCPLIHPNCLGDIFRPRGRKIVLVTFTRGRKQYTH